MSDSQKEAPKHAPPVTNSPWRVYFMSALPFVMTALISVGVTLLLLTTMPMCQQSAMEPEGTYTVHIAPFSTTPVTMTATAQPTQRTPTKAIAAQPAQRTPTKATAQPTRIHTPMVPIEPLPLDETVVCEEIQHVQHELQNLWAAYYLARASSQLADAETALRINDVQEVEQVLVTVGRSLDFAYEQSTEQHKGPISEFRMQVGTMREELYIRPDNMDLRLRRLRQSMLSLVDQDSP